MPEDLEFEPVKRPSDIGSRKEKLFNIPASKPKKTEPEIQNSQPETIVTHPFLNIEMAQQDEKQQIPDATRAKTPIVIPSQGTYAPIVPQADTIESKINNEIIIPSTRRKSMKMLPKPNTAGEERNFNKMNTLANRPPTEPFSMDTLKPPQKMFTSQLKIEQSEPDVFRKTSSVRMNESPKDDNRSIAGTSEFHGDKQQKFSTAFEFYKNREEEKPIESVIKPMTSEPKEQEKPTKTFADLFNSAYENVEVPKEKKPEPIVEPAKKPEKIIEETPPVVQQKKEELKINEKIQQDLIEAERVKIELTANMSRHQVIELNKKISDMVLSLTDLNAENEELKKITNNLQEEQVKKINSVQDELSKIKELHEVETQEHRKAILQVQEEYAKQMQNLEENNKKAFLIAEQEKDKQAETNKKNKAKEKEKLEQLHKLEIDRIEAQRKIDLDAQRKQYEFEIASLKQQIKKDSELNKITSQVDSLVESLKSKMENEHKSKMALLAERSEAADEKLRNLELESMKLDVERKKQEDLKNSLKEREKQAISEKEEANKLSESKKKSLDSQFETKIREQDAKMERMSIELKQLEAEKAELEKVRNEWETTFKDQKSELLLELNVLNKEKEELRILSDEQAQLLNSKMAIFEEKRQALAVEESEYLSKKQQHEEKENLLKKEFDEFQLRLEQFTFQKQQTDEQKERMGKLAVELEEQSRAIYKYKATIENTRQNLESMRAEVDAKEATVNAEKEKIENGKKEIIFRQKQIEEMRFQYMREQNVEQASQRLFTTLNQTPAPMRETFGGRNNTPNMLFTAQKKSHTPAFNATEFIKQIQTEFGQKTKFMDYVTQERSNLMKSRHMIDSKFTPRETPESIYLFI